MGVIAKCNLDLLETVAFTIGKLAGRWIIGYVWNCTLVELLAIGWLKKVKGVIKAPTSATCFGKVYDYFGVAAPSPMTSSASTASAVRASFRIPRLG